MLSRAFQDRMLMAGVVPRTNDSALSRLNRDKSPEPGASSTAEAPRRPDSAARRELDGLRDLLRSASTAQGPGIGFNADEVNEPAGLQRCIRALLEQVTFDDLNLSGAPSEAPGAASSVASTCAHEEPSSPQAELQHRLVMSEVRPTIFRD